MTPVETGAELRKPELANLDALFRGFADPTRLRLLNAMVPGPLCVSDAVEVLGLPQPLVSRHLAYLRRVGLVSVERAAKYARYQLAEPVTPAHASLLSCVRSCFVAVGMLETERAAAAGRSAARSSGALDEAEVSRSA